jgi:GTP-binding protein Era
LKKTDLKSGFVNLVGVPNSGKSTLINKLIGKKISIVSHKVQTTRFCIRGIYNFNLTNKLKSQIIFVDTPGIFLPKRRLEKAMVSAAWSDLNLTDKVVFIHDVSKRLDKNSKEIIEQIFKIKTNLVLVLNKIDLLPKEMILKRISEIKNLYNFEETFLISAKNGSGCNKLIKYLANKMPTHSFFYDENTITDLPHSILAAEITREKLFKNLNQELPYNLTVETEKWDVNSDESINIQQIIYINKQSYKPIILGKQGQNIKKIGIVSRKELEKLLETKVHLFLHIKFKKNWMDDPSKYSSVGLNYNA